MSTVYLLLSILCSSLINLIFRSFNNKVDNTSAIVVNYAVCVLVAWVAGGSDFVFYTDFWNKPWFPYVAISGVLFLSIFYLIALTNQYSGVSVAAAASKLGVVIPVFAGVFMFGESIRWTTVAAILASIVSVVLISRKKDIHLKGTFKWILLPLAVLIGSGIIDTTLKYIQLYHLHGSPESHPTTIIFASAGIAGLFIVLISRRRRQLILQPSSIAGGIILGIPNYFSILFLLLTLNSGNLASVVIFPLNNVSIVALSAIASIVIFREKMSRGNLAGLFLALLSIFVISRYQ